MTILGPVRQGIMFVPSLGIFGVETREQLWSNCAPVRRIVDI
jgi:hypothetical protein